MSGRNLSRAKTEVTNGHEVKLPLVTGTSAERLISRKEFKSAWRPPPIGAAFENKRLMRTLHRHPR
jgi:hypothetical protein